MGRAEVEERHDGIPQLGLVGDLPTLAVRLALLSLSGTLRRCGLGGSPGGLDCRSWGPDPDQPAMGAGPCSGLPRQPVVAGRLHRTGEEGVAGGQEIPVLGGFDLSVVRIPEAIAGVVYVEVLVQ